MAKDNKYLKYIIHLDPLNDATKQQIASYSHIRFIGWEELQKLVRIKSLLESLSIRYRNWHFWFNRQEDKCGASFINNYEYRLFVSYN